MVEKSRPVPEEKALVPIVQDESVVLIEQATSRIDNSGHPYQSKLANRVLKIRNSKRFNKKGVLDHCFIAFAIIMFLIICVNCIIVAAPVSVLGYLFPGYQDVNRNGDRISTANADQVFYSTILSSEETLNYKTKRTWDSIDSANRAPDGETFVRTFETRWVNDAALTKILLDTRVVVYNVTDEEWYKYNSDPDFAPNFDFKNHGLTDVSLSDSRSGRWNKFVYTFGEGQEPLYKYGIKNRLDPWNDSYMVTVNMDFDRWTYGVSKTFGFFMFNAIVGFFIWVIVKIFFAYIWNYVILLFATIFFGKNVFRKEIDTGGIMAAIAEHKAAKERKKNGKNDGGNNNSGGQNTNVQQPQSVVNNYIVQPNAGRPTPVQPHSSIYVNPPMPANNQQPVQNVQPQTIRVVLPDEGPAPQASELAKQRVVPEQVEPQRTQQQTNSASGAQQASQQQQPQSQQNQASAQGQRQNNASQVTQVKTEPKVSQNQSQPAKQQQNAQTQQASTKPTTLTPTADEEDQIMQAINSVPSLNFDDEEK